MNQHKRHVGRRLGLSMLGLVLALTGTELVLRLAIPETAPARFEQDVDELRRIQLPQLAGMLKPDPELFWVLAPDRQAPASDYPFGGIISNARGQREDHLIPYAKPPDQRRVLFLGDSCTYGYGVSIKETFVEQVAGLLRDTLGINVECINAGVPGYSLFQGLRYFETEGCRYQPDVVVATFGWNDMSEWDGLSDLQHHALRAQSTPPAAVRWSRLARALWAFTGQPAGQDSAPRARLLPAEFRSLLAQLQASVESKGGKLVIMVWPMRANLTQAGGEFSRTFLQREMAAYARDWDVVLVDLVPAFHGAAQKFSESSLYLDMGHATPQGHGIVAAQLAPVLGRALKP